ncbi:acyltransferase [Paraburkholderia sp. Ac-20340]|uniref:acyltransferase family protein n=1 Tax=Paraburkholderia sp. Ac-20340 TaxID=2703888 RepID=UPI001980FD25|nr:acyltransferase [Paraburkholderia sp. Ac-20340]MBN3851795.1 acyltransferase [Paraburkholderia sp. Ac-20340]
MGDGGVIRGETRQAGYGGRNGQIDIMRGIAILLVLFHHFNIAYRLDDTALARAIGWDAVRAVARNGNYGVTMFFVISGYLITTNALKRWNDLRNIELRAFYVLRIARIAPALVLLLVVVNSLAWAGIPIFMNHAQQGEPVLSFWLVNLASLTFWMNVLIGAHGWVNYALGVLWSLSVEEVFYLSFPLLCLVLRREAWLFAVWAAFIVIGPLYRLGHQGEEEQFLYAYFACFDGIATGCCAALLARRRLSGGRAQSALRWGVIVLMIWLYLGWPISQSNVFGVTAIASGTAVLLLTARDKSAGWLGFSWLGRLSYELYLFHLIVLGLLRTFFVPALATAESKLILLAVYLLCSAIVSMAIARFYAEPLNRGIRRWFAARHRAATDVHDEDQRLSPEWTER